MRTSSLALRSIEGLILASDLDIDETYSKAQRILEAYRSVCWMSDKKLMDLGIDDDTDKGLMGTVRFLENCPVSANKKGYEVQLLKNTTPQRLSAIVDDCLVQVAKFPGYGKDYLEIINCRYLLKTDEKAEEIYTRLSLERSAYYDRKKEAVMCFGYCLYAIVIPLYKKMHREEEKWSTLAR